MGRVSKGLFSFFLELISISTPRAIVIDFSTIILFLALVPMQLLEQLQSICIFHNFILPAVFYGICPDAGIFASCNCPACGLTRGIASILHGNLAAAYSYNPLSFIVLAVMCGLIAMNAYRL